MDFNNIQVKGKLCDLITLWQGKEEVLYKGILEVPRKGNTNTADHLAVVIPGNLLKDVDVDSFVAITGQIRSKDSIVEDKLKVDLYINVKSISNFNSNLGIEDSIINNNNYVQLNGYICKKPNLRTTPSGKQITDLLIACNYGKDKTAYIPTITWGKVARNASRLKVGDYVALEGKFQSRAYSKMIDGKIYEKMAYELSVDNLNTPISNNNV